MGHLEVRATRDRLIDLLGIAETYPVRDIAVRDEQLTVPFNTSAKIPLEPSQSDVVYQLHDQDQQPVEPDNGPAQEGESGPAQLVLETVGNGARAILETPRIQEDITYHILAKKLLSGRENYLHQTATVKVGLDVTLKARILNAAFLDPSTETPTDTDARIVAYEASVEVEILGSQEGVDYRLITYQDNQEVSLSAASVRGDLNDIVIQSQPFFEDTDIRIHATKTFDVSENRPTQTAVLEVVLPLKVRPNPIRQVTLQAAIIDLQQAASVRIVASQPQVEYQCYRRTIRDREFIRQTVPADSVLSVAVTDKPDVQVAKPAQAGDVWGPSADYIPVGSAQLGTGADLVFGLNGLGDDSMLIVRAQKSHQAQKVVVSAVQIEQALVILVRPNPDPGLSLQATAQPGAWQVSGGQAGVLYYFRPQPDGEEFAIPVYFHQTDDDTPQVNKGVGQLGMHVDFVIARDLPPQKISQFPTLAEVPPELPILEVGTVPAGTALSVRAVKAQTGVEADVAQAVILSQS